MAPWHYCQRFQRSNSHSSTKEECNDYDCWTLSGNRSSCHLCSSIKCYVFVLCSFQSGIFGISLLCALICVLSYDQPCSSIFVIYICFVCFTVLMCIRFPSIICRSTLFSGLQICYGYSFVCFTVHMGWIMVCGNSCSCVFYVSLIWEKCADAPFICINMFGPWYEVR